MWSTHIHNITAITLNCIPTTPALWIYNEDISLPQDLNMNLIWLFMSRFRSTIKFFLLYVISWDVQYICNLFDTNVSYFCQRPTLITWGGWGCEVSCGGHHRPRGKTTMGSALDGVVFDIAQILAYLVHNMSRSQLYLGFGRFGWLPSFFRSITFLRAYG